MRLRSTATLAERSLRWVLLGLLGGLLMVPRSALGQAAGQTPRQPPASGTTVSANRHLLVAGEGPVFDTLAAELQVALGSEGWSIRRTGAQLGFHQAELTAADEAAAVLWIEGEQAPRTLWVVPPTGDPRSALLPAPGDVDPADALIVALGVLDEIEAPPQHLRIRVQVSVESDDGTRFVVDEVQTTVSTGDNPEGETTTQEPVVVEEAEATDEADPDEADPDAAFIDEPPVDDPPPTEEELPSLFLGFDFAPFVGMSSVPWGRGRRGLSLGVLGTYSQEVRGVALSSVTNIIGGDLRAAAVTGVWNHVGGDADALLVSGFGNHIAGDLRGLSIGAVWNSIGTASESDFVLEGAAFAGGGTLIDGGLRGISVAAGGTIVRGSTRGAMGSVGLLWTRDDMNGVSITGGFNGTGGEHFGIQTSGCVNWAGSLTGLQVGGCANIVGDRMDGLQLSPINVTRTGSGAQVGNVNVSRGRFAGVQVGLLNIAKDSDFSLGFLNIILDGRTEVELTVSLEGFGFAAIKHGSRNWHYLYSIGGRPFGDGSNDPVAAFGLGLGVRFEPRERFSLDLDLVAHYLHDGEGVDIDGYGDGAELLGQLRLTGAVRLLPKVSLLVGLSGNILAAREDRSNYASWSRSIKDLEEDRQGSWAARIWPSLNVGVRFF